jgi:alpha-galactosidase
VVLTGDLPEDQFRFHATAMYASGGMILSGDDLTKIPPERLAMLKRLLPPTGVAASFEDDSMQVGMIKPTDARMIAVFNWKDQPQTVSIRLPGSCHIADFWTGQSLGRHEGVFTVEDIPSRSSRLFRCKA